MKKQFPIGRCARVLFLALAMSAGLAASLGRPALAQQPTLSGGGSAQQDRPPKYGGVKFDYALYSSSGLNKFNYNNSLDSYFLPTWNFGQLLFRGTRFSRMALAVRWIVSKNLAGYDDSQFTGQSEGVLTPCANLTPNANGTVDVTSESVPRCDYAAQRRTADWNDMWFTLRSPAIYTIPKLGIVISPSIRVVAPTSIQSRLATLKTAITPSLGLSRSFFDGKLTLAYGFGATKNFHGKTSPSYRPYQDSSLETPLSHNIGYTSSAVDRNSADFYVDQPTFGRTGTGTYNTDYAFLNMFTLAIAPVNKLSISALYILFDAYTYRATCDERFYGADTCASGNTVAANSGSSVFDVGHRDSHVLWISVDYQVLDWLGLTFAWVNWSPRRKPDGSPRQPFISTDYNAFTTISLGLSISIDGAISKIEEAVEKKKAARLAPPPGWTPRWKTGRNVALVPTTEALQ